MIRLSLVFLLVSSFAWAETDPFAGSDWSLTKVICKSGKPDIPKGWDVVWVQSFQAGNKYRLYETLNYKGQRVCDNLLYGSYEVKPNQQVALTTLTSPDTEMCEVNPFGTWLWNYEISADGSGLVLTGTADNQGNCEPGDPVQFYFRKM